MVPTTYGTLVNNLDDTFFEVEPYEFWLHVEYSEFRMIDISRSVGSSI